MITALSQDSSSATVSFVDYGNEATVDLKFIVADRSKIPPGQEDFIDENVVAPALSDENEDALTPHSSPENVDTAKKGWAIGDECVARWAEDEVIIKPNLA